jgi:transposase
MAMGTGCKRQRQQELFYTGELAEAPGHPFYSKLNETLEAAGFDAFCEQRCQAFYHDRLGRPSLTPGNYFRLQLIGFFEGVGSERGIAWRVADSLSLRSFLGYSLDETTPDHVTLSRTRRLLDAATHQAVFGWVLERLGETGLLRGKTIGVDATTLEANAAMRSIVRRASGESYREYLKQLATAAGEPSDAAAVQRKDRKRKKKKVSNKDWMSPHDPAAEITKMKDGRTRLAYKAEQAVDLETGAIVATTTHPGATGDTTSVRETVPKAGEAVAEQLAKSEKVWVDGVAEVVADKGYHSAETLVKLAEWGVRSYVSEPERGRRKWSGKAVEQAATYANRRRVRGERGKTLLRSRGEKVERPFAHQYETGGMRRLWVRGLGEVHKKLVLQAAACNLALLLRTKHGAGTPRGLAESKKAFCGLILALLGALKPFPDESAGRINRSRRCDRFRRAAPRIRCSPGRRRKIEGFDTAC